MKNNNFFIIISALMLLNSSCGYAVLDSSEDYEGSSSHVLVQRSSKKPWHCTGVIDLGAGHTNLCSNCHTAQVRYVHKMADNNGNTHEVGYVCAGRLASIDNELESIKKAVSTAKNRTRKPSNAKL